jgi:hypothetical protein
MNLNDAANGCKFINDDSGNDDNVDCNEAGYAAVVVTKYIQFSYSNMYLCK